MTLSALQKLFLPPLVVSVGVFSAMSFPIATLGDKQITIKFQEEPLFYGRLRDVAIPYVVMATLLSIGTGVSAAAFCGWQDSSRKSVKFQKELFTLEKDLEAKEAILNELKLSESRLETSGLTPFLDEQLPLLPARVSNSLPTAQNLVVTTPAPIHQPPATSVQSVATTTKNITKTTKPVTASSSFSSAQNFMGYAQANTNIIKEPVLPEEVNQKTITASDLEELQKQLREMMLQMQTMQDNLRVVPQAANNNHPKVANKFQIYYETANTNEVQLR